VHFGTPQQACPVLDTGRGEGNAEYGALFSNLLVHCGCDPETLFFKGLFDQVCAAWGKAKRVSPSPGPLGRHSHADNFCAILQDNVQSLLELASLASNHHFKT
jgi:hypothetical protein